MEKFISDDALRKLTEANSDAALLVHPEVPEQLGAVRKPSAAALLQCANMIVVPTRRERGIYFVR